MIHMSEKFAKKLAAPRAENMQPGQFSTDDLIDDAAGITASQVLASLPNPLFILDSDNRFVFLNQAAEMFFGQPGYPIWLVPRQLYPGRCQSVFDVATGTLECIGWRSGAGIRWTKAGAQGG